MRIDRLMLACLAAALLSVVFWSGQLALTRSELQHLQPGQKYSIWNGRVFAGVPFEHSRAQLLKDHKEDFPLRLALAEQSDEVETRKAFKKLIADFPSEPAAYAAAIESRLTSTSYCNKRFKKGDIPLKARSSADNCTPEEVAQLLELAESAISVDANNGYFHCARAVALYSAGRDDEALDAVHNAAGCREFTNYAHLISRSRDHLVDLRGGFCPDYRVVEKTCVAYPDVINLRDVAKITAYLAKQKIRQGHVDEGVAIATDLTTAGYAMARDSESVIGGLTASSMFASGVGALDPTAADNDKSAKSSSEQRAARAAGFLEATGYPDEAKEIRYQSKTIDDFAAAAKKLVGHIVDRSAGLLVFNHAFYIQTELLGALFVLMPAWLAFRLLTLKLGTDSYWDKRAALVSAMFAGTMIAFFLGVMVYSLQGNMPDILSQAPKTTWHSNVLDGLFWFALLLVVVSAVVMARRSKASSQTIWSIPKVIVVIAGVSVIAGIAINAYGLSGTGFHRPYVQQILLPIMLVGLYAGFRAFWLRRAAGFNGAVSIFAVTVRNGSAVAIIVFTLAYIATIPIISVGSHAADGFARECVTSEASAIHRVFK